MKAKATSSLVVAIILIIATFIGCAPAAVPIPAEPTPIPDNYLIVPGERIGPYSLDMSSEQFLAKLGEASEIREIELRWGKVKVYLWKNHGIYIVVHTDDKRQGQVFEIWILNTVANNANFRTVEGLRIGSTRSQAQQIYGSPLVEPGIRQEYFRDAKDGIIGFLFIDERANAVAVARLPHR